jgi:hypothetical protein
MRDDKYTSVKWTYEQHRVEDIMYSDSCLIAAFQVSRKRCLYDPHAEWEQVLHKGILKLSIQLSALF